MYNQFDVVSFTLSNSMMLMMVQMLLSPRLLFDADSHSQTVDNKTIIVLRIYIHHFKCW